MGPGLAEGLREVLHYFFNIIQLLVFASFVVSWVGDRDKPIVQMIYNITEPIYRPMRRLTSKIPGPFDWAPMIVMLVVIFLDRFFMAFLSRYAQTGF